MKNSLFAVSAVAALAAFSAAEASSISTLGFWDGSYSVNAWGGAATNTYGEVITAPGGSLTSFTFEVNDNGTPASYVAEVYAWGGSPIGGSGPQGVVGPALYTSGAMTTSGDGLFDAITINTGGVALAAGQDYVIDLYDNGDGVSGKWGLIGPLGSHPGVPGDNGFNFNNGPSNSIVWDDSADFGSLAFSATFSAPEPASWALMLVGVAGLGAVLRSSRKSIATAA